MNDEIAKLFIYIYSAFAIIFWVIVLVIKIITLRDKELIIKWASKMDLFPERLSKLKKFLLLYVIGSLGIAVTSILLGLEYGGMDKETGKIFFWAASLFLLTSLYLTAIYYLSSFIEKGIRE